MKMNLFRMYFRKDMLWAKKKCISYKWRFSIVIPPQNCNPPRWPHPSSNISSLQNSPTSTPPSKSSNYLPHSSRSPQTTFAISYLFQISLIMSKWKVVLVKTYWSWKWFQIVFKFKRYQMTKIIIMTNYFKRWEICGILIKKWSVKNIAKSKLWVNANWKYSTQMNSY